MTASKPSAWAVLAASVPLSFAAGLGAGVLVNPFPAPAPPPPAVVAPADKGSPVYERVRAKNDAVNDLVAGRLTLPEAVARFRELNAGDEGLVDAVRAAWPAETYGGSLAAQVVNWALFNAAETAPDKLGEVKARLEAQARAFRPD